MRQLTGRAIALGIVLAVVLAGANAYLGLFAGMTVSASIPAAVISMALLKLFGDSNILENNIVQTAASAGESLAAGAIFTLPALILLGYWSAFDYWWVYAICGIGGLLGVLFTIPLRRALIVERGLAYPEGTATAAVLRVGEKPSAGARQLGMAALAGGAMKLCETALRLWPGTAQTAIVSGNGFIAYIGANLSPALLGVGYIIGLNIATVVFLGGAFAWYIAIPLYSMFFVDEGGRIGLAAVDVAFEIWDSRVRYVGVGAMLSGGIWALVSMRGSLVGALRPRRRVDIGEVTPTEREHDLPSRFVAGGTLFLLIPIFLLYRTVIGSTEVGLILTTTMLIAGFLFAAVAAYMAGLVGSSNNPISGITIATILATSLLLVMLVGADSPVGASAAILVGGVVCCAAAIGGDNMQDLKAGYIVGATPWKQQVMQFVGVMSAALVIAPILNLLLEAYGIGARSSDMPNALAAPQATLMAAVAGGVFGGQLPWNMVYLGAGIGAVVIAIDEVLRKRDSGVRTPVLAVAVGIYLPLELTVPILAGGLVARVTSRTSNTGSQRGGVLFAAGLITGEALIGILVAIPIVLTGNPDFIAMPESLRPGLWLGLPALGLIALALFRSDRGTS